MGKPDKAAGNGRLFGTCHVSSPTDRYKASQCGASDFIMKSPGKFPGLFIFNSPALKNWMGIVESRVNHFSDGN
jgi:hypothetical protein